MRYAETVSRERRYGLYTSDTENTGSKYKGTKHSFGAPLVGCSHLRLRWIRGTKPHSPNAQSKKHGLHRKRERRARAGQWSGRNEAVTGRAAD